MRMSMIFLKIGCFIVATLSIKSHRLRHQGRSSQNDEYKSQPSPHGVTGLQTGQLLPRFLTPDTALPQSTGVHENFPECSAAPPHGLSEQPHSLMFHIAYLLLPLRIVRRRRRGFVLLAPPLFRSRTTALAYSQQETPKLR